MKKTIYAAVGVACLFASSSCRKDSGPIPPQNPLSSEYQVVEYHRADFDDVNEPVKIFPFKKIYSGKTVVEIDGSYDFPIGLSFYNHYGYREAAVSQKGRMVYLIDKHNLKNGGPDTLLKITLNAKGRPESSIADSTWFPPGGFGNFNVNETYSYKDNRLVAVSRQRINSGYYAGNSPETDSLVYDQYGDLLSFNGNSYEYDYTHPAKQQFYCEGWQNDHEGFQYLEYLGYFPEVTNPPYIMTQYTNAEGPEKLFDHTFDNRGRLISWDLGPLGPTTKPWTTITWK